MRPKKILIDRAVANGSMDRMNRLLSASHILVCTANNLIMEASDIMAENGLMLGELKRMYNIFAKSADRYMTDFGSMIETESVKMDMFSDLEEFEKLFRSWAKIEQRWNPENHGNEADE